jgi:protein SCO1/2
MRVPIVPVAAILTLCLAGGALTGRAWAETPAAGQGQTKWGESVPPVPEKLQVGEATVKLADVEVLDQDGRRLNFRKDVVGDRIAVIDTIYTTCPLICPLLSAVMLDVQGALGDRLGKEVTLVSVTVDPNTDIPPRLKEFAERWEAKPGWLFLTGAKPDVDAVLKGLDAYATDFTEHPAMFLVGDGKTGVWTRFYGFPSPEQIVARIEELRGRKSAN